LLTNLPLRFACHKPQAKSPNRHCCPLPGISIAPVIYCPNYNAGNVINSKRSSIPGTNYDVVALMIMTMPAAIGIHRFQTAQPAKLFLLIYLYLFINEGAYIYGIYMFLPFSIWPVSGCNCANCSCNRRKRAAAHLMFDI